MPVNISFETKSADFEDWGYLAVATILEVLAQDANRNNTNGIVRDRNGNKIGTWEITLDFPQQEDEK